MKNRTQMGIGLALIVVGLIYVISILLDIDLRGSFWAFLLIILGIWLLLRPGFSGSDGGDFRFFGDVVRRGAWKVSGQEHWSFIGDVKLDFTEAEIPQGETVIRKYAFLGDFKVIAPPDLPLSLSATGMISEVRLFGQKRDGFFVPNDLATPGYENADRKIRLEMVTFLGGVKVREG